METVERLVREEIRRDGSISFARFMERALLEPGLGYYATAERRVGRSGDFMTAPELHPILGAAIAELAGHLEPAEQEELRTLLKRLGRGIATPGEPS